MNCDGVLSGEQVDFLGYGSAGMANGHTSDSYEIKQVVKLGTIFEIIFLKYKKSSSPILSLYSSGGLQ